MKVSRPGVIVAVLGFACAVHALVDEEGDFVIGPEYAASSELTVKAGVPVGKVSQFTMDSKDSRFYPGIARDVFGTVDPNNPKTLIVDTHPKEYQRTITVYRTRCCRASSTT